MANTFGKLGGGEIETTLAVLLFSARGKSAREQTVSEDRGSAQARGGDAVPLVAPTLRFSSMATGDVAGAWSQPQLAESMKTETPALARRASSRRGSQLMEPKSSSSIPARHERDRASSSNRLRSSLGTLSTPPGTRRGILQEFRFFFVRDWPRFLLFLFRKKPWFHHPSLCFFLKMFPVRSDAHPADTSLRSRLSSSIAASRSNCIAARISLSS